MKFHSPVKIQSLDQYHLVKVRAGSTISAAITSDNEILVWGSGEFGILQVPIKLVGNEDVKFVDIALCSSGKDAFGAAVDIDGFLYTLGDN